ncbi:MAG: SHOCT domain-containing protein [Pirellulaceae bacterium]
MHITGSEVFLMMDGYGFGHGFGILFWILILVLVVVAAGFMFRGFGGGTRPDPSISRDRSALEILETRYARGEIEHDEFERRKRDLQDRNNSA